MVASPLVNYATRKARGTLDGALRYVPSAARCALLSSRVAVLAASRDLPFRVYRVFVLLLDYCRCGGGGGGRCAGVKENSESGDATSIFRYLARSGHRLRLQLIGTFQTLF